MNEPADRLMEAWTEMQEAYREAVRELDYGSPERARFEAYVDQVFDPDSRMLGMRSVDAWMRELRDAVTR